MSYGSNEFMMGLYRAQAKVPDSVQLETFQSWRAKGYAVKKGEHSQYKTLLWVCGNFKIAPKGESKTLPDPETGEEKEMRKKGFTLKMCYFFTQEQVEPIKEKKDGKKGNGEPDTAPEPDKLPWEK